MTDRDWMAQALAEAEAAAAEGEIPVGAVLVAGETCLWADHNRREATHDPTAHAELRCLQHGGQLQGDWRLQDCTLYVTLEPCAMCAGAIAMSRLGRVVFAAADPEKGCCGSVYDLPGDLALGAATRWTAGVCQAEAAKLLQDFFQRRRHGPLPLDESDKGELA